MLNLVNKELKLSINKFFFILPLMLSLLFFIPQWFYTLIFMYMFWITVPQIYSGYISNQDYNFVSMLPVSKKDIVSSKVIALVVIELLHLGFAAIFAVVHNQIYGVFNFSLDANYSLFGIGFLMYGMFNIIFFPYFFKTGYFFGKPVIAGTIVTLIYGGIIEYGMIRFEFMREIFEGTIGSQLIVLIVGLVGGILLTIIGIKVSQKKYEQIDQ